MKGACFYDNHVAVGMSHTCWIESFEAWTATAPMSWRWTELYDLE